MKNLLLLLISLSIILVSCGDNNDPVIEPVIENKGSLLPLAVGNEWVMKSETAHIEEHKIVLDRSTEIEYQGTNVTAFHSSWYSKSKDGIENGESWIFEYYSNLYEVENLDDLSNPERLFNNRITTEAARNGIKMYAWGDVFDASTENIIVLGESKECLKLTKTYGAKPDYEIFTYYFLPGIGLVQHDFENADKLVSTKLSECCIK